MSMLQLGLLLLVSAPFAAAVWIAHTNGYRSSEIAGPAPANEDTFAVLGLTRPPSAAQTLDLDKEVRAVAGAAEAFAREHLVRIDLAIGKEAKVRIDPIAFRTALRSLVDAAIRASTGGQVLITAQRLGSQMHVRVIDDGTEAHQTTREILLRETVKLIALQGGSLAVDAWPGNGTTVTMQLPLSVGTNSGTADNRWARDLAEQEV